MSSNQSQKPEISYPCPWEYKVIGADDQAVARAVQECVAGLDGTGAGPRQYELGFSRASNKGKYLSFLLALEVRSEEERNGLFRALSAQPAIVMVI